MDINALTLVTSLCGGLIFISGMRIKFHFGLGSTIVHRPQGAAITALLVIRLVHVLVAGCLDIDLTLEALLKHFSV